MIYKDNIFDRVSLGGLAVCLLFAVLRSVSASAQATTAPSEPVQEVAVVGERAGPSLWRVTKGDHVLWLLGTLDPLPRKMTWRSREVESVLSEAQEVIPSNPS